MPGSRLYRSRRESRLQKLLRKRREEQSEWEKNETLSSSFQDAGFVGPIQVLSREEAHKAFQEYEKWKESLPHQSVTGDLRFKPHLFLPFVNSIVHHPNLVHAVQLALQTPNILLWSSDFNVKEPQSSKCFKLHQDSTYAGLSPAEKCLTAWVAISDPVGEREGCLGFWKESHKQGQLRHVEEPSEDNMLSRGQHLVEPLTKEDCVTIPLRGGEATLHQFFTVHCSGPNESTNARVGLAIRYIAASVVQTGKTRETVTLISGSVEHDGFDLEPVLPDDPTAADISKGKEAHAEAMRREAANYFDGTDASGYD